MVAGTSGPARSRHAARLLEGDDPMQDTDMPPRRSDADEAEAEVTQDEASMRLALERLGTRSSPAPRTTGGGASATPRPRPRFARDVPVVRVPATARLPGEAGRELAEERAARLRAEEALADAQGTLGRLQVARARAEQTLQAAQAAVEEREAAMAGLRAELARALQREAALVEAAQVAAEARLKPAPAPPEKPEPVRWWLDYVKAPRS